MKKLYFFSLIALAISILAGCAQISTVGPASSNEQAVVKLNIVIDKTGELKKVAAVTVPTAPTILLANWDGTLKYDTIPIVKDTIKLSRTVKKGLSYEYIFYTFNPLAKYNFNSGRVSFTAPQDADTFSVSVSLEANLVIVNSSLKIKGSPVDGLAKHAKLTWSLKGATHWVDSAEVDLTPADTAVTLMGYMGVDSRYVFGYDYALTIECSDGQYAYGTGTLDNVVPSTDYSLVIPMKMYDKNGAIVNVAVSLKKWGTATISFIWQ